jgi:general secretion pathway protein N
MNAANQRRLTPVLVMVGGLLCAVLVALFSGAGRGVHWLPRRALAPLPPQGDPANVPQPLPLAQFSLVWQRPLFNPDRKPVAHAASAAAVGLGDLELTGVIITDDLRMALLHDKKTDHEVRLRQGEKTPDGSITLIDVQARSAIFDSSAGRTELKLPNGAPITPLKHDRDANADADQAAGTGGMRMVRPPSSGLHPSRRSSRMPARRFDNIQKLPQGSVLERLRQLRNHAQTRRAQRDAASH